MHSTDELLLDHVADHDSGYVFLDADMHSEDIEIASNEGLITGLVKIKAKVQGVIRSKSYEDVRSQYIEVNKALNVKGTIPPRFRPSLSAGSRAGTDRDRDVNLISNDHQVLDLHWLSLNCGFDQAREKWIPDRWHGLFVGELDYEIAQVFAGKGGSSKLKASEILRLTEEEQFQLRSIQSEATRSWWRHHRANQEQVRAAVLSGQIKNAKLRGCEKTWPNAWLAIQCADRAGLSAVIWYEMITGDQLSASTISNIKKRVPMLVKLERLSILDGKEHKCSGVVLD